MELIVENTKGSYYEVYEDCHTYLHTFEIDCPILKMKFEIISMSAGLVTKIGYIGL